MPGDRWWEFEDARVHFGAVRPGPEDPVSLLLLQFALIYGNDWFVVPLQLPAGSLCSVNSMVVTDSFGFTTTLQPFEEGGGAGVNWRMFTLSGTGDLFSGTQPGTDMLFVPPSLGRILQGPPVEEVVLLRDEMANLAWAVEAVAESPTGGRVNRRDIWNASHGAPEVEMAAPAGGSGSVSYRLATEVPDYWIPLVPVREFANGPLRLRRGTVPRQDGIQPRPMGRLLTPIQPLSLHDEEVTRSGAVVTRSWQYARWSDGSAHLWIGRRKEQGRGEGSSGLRFDSLEPG
jgi:hypothetical protein